MGPEIRPFDLTEASAILKLYSSRIIYVYCRLLLMVENRRDYTKKGKPPNPKNPKQKPQSQHQRGKWEKERRTGDESQVKSSSQEKKVGDNGPETSNKWTGLLAARDDSGESSIAKQTTDWLVDSFRFDSRQIMGPGVLRLRFFVFPNSHPPSFFDISH